MTAEERAALVEKVGKVLAKSGYAQAGIRLTDPYTADADYWNALSTAAIDLIRAEVLEEAAKECAYHWTPKECAAAIRALKEKQ